MIRANNPEIDVDELMGRVREEAAQLRASGVVEARRGDRHDIDDRAVARALERHRAIETHLREAEERNRRRAALPHRFARFEGLLGFAGRFVLRAFNYATKQQREVAAAQTQALRIVAETAASAAEYAQRLSSRIDELDRSTRELDARLALRIDDVQRALALIPDAAAIQALQNRLMDQVREVDRHIVDVQKVAERAASFARSDIASLRRNIGHAVESAPAEVASTEAFPVSPAVIALIEDRFRGSSQHVRTFAEPYIERIQAAGTVTDATPLLDLGSGRGDFLALLKERSLAARGVDASDIAVAQARERGLEVAQGDALAALSSAADASLGAVTAIHMIEHMPFGALTALVEQALRALRPGGILILETPNPRNLRVATYTFRFDPTHRQPIPSELLALVLEASGFAEIQTLDLHPPIPPEIAPESPLAELNARFFGAQDYAVVAVRPR